MLQCMEFHCMNTLICPVFIQQYRYCISFGVLPFCCCKQQQQLIMCHSHMSFFRARTGHWLHLCQQALFTTTYKDRRQHCKEVLCPSVQSSWEIQIHFFVSGQLFVQVDFGRIMIKLGGVVYEILHMKSCILSCQIQYQR